MDWRYLFTSMDGRINRRAFWMGIVVLIVISLIASIIDLVLGLPTVGQRGPVGIIVSIILIYPSIALSAKRWHDRDKSAWWILINLVPIIGWIWSLVETGFLVGTSGPNRYGADPLAT